MHITDTMSIDNLHATTSAPVHPGDTLAEDHGEALSRALAALIQAGRLASLLRDGAGQRGEGASL